MLDVPRKEWSACKHVLAVRHPSRKVCLSVPRAATAYRGFRLQWSADPPYPPASSATYTGPQETSGKATASLILGIAAYLILPFLAAIPAIILGHLALSDIKKKAGRLKGDGL